MGAVASRWQDGSVKNRVQKKAFRVGMSLLETGGAPWEAELKIHRKGYEYNIQSKTAINQIILKNLSPIWNGGLAILSGDEED